MSHHLDLVIKFVCLALTVCDVKGETAVLLQSAIESTIEKAEFVDHNGNIDPMYDPCTYTGCDQTSTAASTGPTAMPEPIWGNGANYAGFQTKTRSGKACQGWFEQSPHAHSLGGHVDGGGEHRFCRNPDGEPTIWCYTVDPNSRWEFCDVLTHASIIAEGGTSLCQMLVSEPNCAVSPRYYASGENYGNSQSCSFKTNKDYKVHSVAFQTERNFDFLNIAGTAYHGTGNTWDGVRYQNAGSDGSAGKSQPITWISDGSVTQSGWKICIVAKIPQHFKMDDHRGGNQQGLRCPLVSQGGMECVTSEGSTYGNSASCTFEAVQGDAGTPFASSLPSIFSKYFSTEANFDFLYTDCLSPSTFTMSAARGSACAYHGAKSGRSLPYWGGDGSYAGKFHWKTDGSVVNKGWLICMYNAAHNNAVRSERRRRGRSESAETVAVGIGNALLKPPLAVAGVFEDMGGIVAGWFR